VSSSAGPSTEFGFDVVPQHGAEIVVDLGVMGNAVPKSGTPDEIFQILERVIDIGLADVHRFWPDVDADPMDRIEHLPAPGVVQERADVDAETDRLAVQEFFAGEIL